MSEIKFTDDFLMALNNWQNGWEEDQERKRVITDELLKHCPTIDKKFKNIYGPCYRKRFIRQGEIVPLIIDNYIEEGVTSWSLDLKYTKEFKGHRYYYADTKFAMVV